MPVRRPPARSARALLAAAALAVAGTAVAVPGASAALLAPSLTTDTGYAPPSGIARFNFFEGTAPEVPAAIAVDGDRTYTVGEVRGPDGNTNIAVVVRRRDGSLDPSFNGNGRKSIDVLRMRDATATATPTDAAYGIVVLPDGRLRIAGVTDTDPGAPTDLDAIVVGLKRDGSTDTAFGGQDPDGAGAKLPTPGVATVASTANNEQLNDIALSPSGRLAVAGFRTVSGQNDTLVSLRQASGAPVTTFGTDGTRVVARAATTMDDQAVDVELRPGGGLVALLGVETNTAPNIDDSIAVLKAFRDDGSDLTGFGTNGETVLSTGLGDTIPNALIVHDGRLWATGCTRPAGGADRPCAGNDSGTTDADAFLARTDGNGKGQQARRFDMRGFLVASDQAALSEGADLAIVPGTPTSLAVVGGVTYTFNGDRRTDWAAAAFNTLDGDLAKAKIGDLALETPNRVNRLAAVAAYGPNALAVAGSLDAEPTSGGSVTIDTSFGNARLRIDAEKRCDLAVRITDPLELVFSGLRNATVRAEVKHVGSRPCAGTIDVAAPFRATRGSVRTGMLTPGDTFTTPPIEVAYTGPRPLRQSVLQTTVTALGDTDVDASDNTGALAATFSYCDVALSRLSGAAELPNEGTRGIEFGLSNTGTIPCRDARIAIAGSALLRTPFDPFTLRAGRTASDRLPIAPGSGLRRVGATVPFTVSAATSTEDVDRANDTLTLTARVVGVGDSDVRRTKARSITGKAKRGRGGAKRSRTKLKRVEVAVRRLGGKGCRSVTGTRGRLGRTAKPKGGCPRVWIKAKGTSSWRLRFKRKLPKGRYVVVSRAITRNGFAEAKFTGKDRNSKTFRVR